MADDVVEIIEFNTEVIEISDDEEVIENNNDEILLIYDSAVSDEGGNENVITVKQEVTETPEENLPAVEASSTKQTNANVIIKKSPTVEVSRNRKRKRTRRKKLITGINGNNAAVQMAGSPNGNHNKMPRSDTSSSSIYATGSSSPIIKQENEPVAETLTETNLNGRANNVADGRTHNSNTNETARPINRDFSKLSWLKPLKNLSSPPNLQLVIIDRGHPAWKIENNNWLMIEKRLLETLHTEMLRTNDKSIGLFDGAKWQRGIKVVGCHNKKTLNFIKNFILTLDKLWEGAQLDVCTMASFVRQICKVYVPPPILKTDVILSLIKLQNPSLCCDDWEVLEKRERNQGIEIWLTISEESYTYLRRLRGEIKYGINRLFVKPVV